MRVLVTTEARFDRMPDGTCWNVGSEGYEFWQRYLDEFEEVCVLARVRHVLHTPPGSVRADGPRVSLAPLPHYVGPWAYLRNYPLLRRTARRAVQPPDDAVIVRAPGNIGTMVVPALRRSGRPFGIEVVGDPHDVFIRGGVRSVLRPILRYVIPRALRRQCAQACAAAYVTANSLQQRYPAPAATHVTRYSSIDLPEEAFVGEPRPQTTAKTQRLVFVGSLEQAYKGLDVLLDALAATIASGADLHLTVIGDGKYRHGLEERANSLGLMGRVRFLGHLPPGDAVRRELDAADLFVHPSRTEGLPRALIEAMARGLPCVGSSVGGIPELLSPSERVPPSDVGALAAKLFEVLGDSTRLLRLSRENLEKAREYHADTLRPRRQAFYRAVRDATLEWQRHNRQ